MIDHTTKLLFAVFGTAMLFAALGLFRWYLNRVRAAERVKGIKEGLRQAGLLPGTSYTILGPDGERVLHILGPGERTLREQPRPRLLRAGF